MHSEPTGLKDIDRYERRDRGEAFGVRDAAAALGLNTRGLKTLLRAGLLKSPPRRRIFALSAFDSSWVRTAKEDMLSQYAEVRAVLLHAGIPLPVGWRRRKTVSLTPHIPPVKDLPGEETM